MSSSSAAAITAFRRRVGSAAFVAGALQALVVSAVVWALALVAVRLFGAYLAPQWWWTALALPVIAWGGIRARREAFGAGVAAAHLDRRLGLDGLLLCVGEGHQLDATWSAHLERRLAAARSVLPRLRWRRLLPGPLLAVAVAASLACLPPPPEPPRVRQLPTYQAEVGRLDAELRDLFERGHVPEEVEKELEQKLRQLQRQVATGEVPEWREFDELDQRIAREQLMQLMQAADAARGSDGAGEGLGESRERAISSLIGAAGMLERLGLLGKLQPMLLEALQQVRNPDGTFRLDELPFDAAEFQALAEAFAGAFAGLDLGELDLQALGLDEGVLGELGALVEGLGACDFGGEARGVGRGGVSRGPGHAALSFTESAAGAAAQAMPLPPGRGLPVDWVPVGSERITPVVAPQPNTAAGSAGATGTGGPTWQLEYAPRHRAVLRRFFSEEGR